MEAGQMRLPRYAKGLKLIRIGVFAMVAQAALVVILLLSLLLGFELADRWGELIQLVNLGAVCLMLAGTWFALSDFRFVRLPTHRVYVAAAGFAVTLIALGWAYHVSSEIERILSDPAVSYESVLHAQEKSRSLKSLVLVKDVGYGAGLIAVLRIVRQSAVANDRLYLRDAASSLTGMFVLMLIGDVFYQLTYGMAGGVFPMLALFGALILFCFWLYCHLRMARFLENAAYLADEPHHVPAATIVRERARIDTPPPPSPRSSSSPTVATPPAPPRSTPSAPSASVAASVAAPIVVPAAEIRSTAAPVSAPRTNSADSEALAEPKLLR